MIMKRTTTYILIVVGILVLVNLLSDNFFLRLDLTADNRYTLSNATKDIVRNLEEPVTITAYFSKDVPTQMSQTKRDFKELLVEYNNISKGTIVYNFIDPSATQDEEQKAMSAGIQPVIATIRDKNEAKQQKVYLGAVVSMGEESEVIPFMKPGAAMEYALSSAIKKISIKDKPSIGFIQGDGEPSLGAMPQAMNALNVMYQVEPVYLNDIERVMDFEFMQKFSDPPKTHCPECGGELKKLISECTFHLKGTGWYATDYAASKSNGKSAKGSGHEKSTPVPEGKASDDAGKAKTSDEKQPASTEASKTSKAEKPTSSSSD